MVNDVDETGDNSGLAQRCSTRASLNRKMSKSQQAEPAITHTDVHIVALSPTEFLEGDDPENLPRITTGQVIETGGSIYEVLWQEDLNECAKTSERKDLKAEKTARPKQLTQPCSEKRDLEKVTKMLETWFWQDWTKGDSSVEKEPKSGSLRELGSDDKIADQNLAISSPVRIPAAKMVEHQGENNIAYLVVPPNSMQTSRRSSRNPSSIGADECEITEAAARKGNLDARLTDQVCKHDINTAPVTSSRQAEARSMSCSVSPSVPEFNYHSPPLVKPSEQAVKNNDATAKADPEPETTSQSRITSIAARRLSDLTTKEHTFRDHRDSLLLARQRILSIGGGIDTGTSLACPRQDSLVLTRKRLLRARKAQPSRLSNASEPVTVAPQTASNGTIISAGSLQYASQLPTYRLMTSKGLSPIFNASVPAETDGSRQNVSSVNDRDQDETAPIAGSPDGQKSYFMRNAVLGGASSPGKALDSSCNKRGFATCLGSSGGGDDNDDAAATASFEMPVLVS